MIETINRAINLANETVRDRSCSDTVAQGAKNLLPTAIGQAIRIRATNRETQAIEDRQNLPNFQKEFPTVFPEKILITLPPLHNGLNHTINLDETQKKNFRNEYRRIPEN